MASLVSRYVPSGDVPDVVKKLLLKPIVRWIRSGEIALLYMAVSDCCKYSEKLPGCSGRRPPSSDVDAIEAENFESGGR